MADWTTAIVKDEMRGTETEIIDNWAKPIDGHGPELYIFITKAPKSIPGYNILFSTRSGYPRIDCKDSCEISMRFDESNVIKKRFIAAGSDNISPDYPASLVRSLSFARFFYIEIPATDGLTYQYKVDLSNLKINADAYPQINIAGVRIGADQSTLPGRFEPYESQGCLKAVNVPIADGHFIAPEATVCIRKNKIASISFYNVPAKNRKEFNSYLKSQFGSIEKLAEEYYSWPQSRPNINYNTVQAVSILGRYIVFDVLSDSFDQ